MDPNKGTLDIWAKEGKPFDLRNILEFIETLGFAPIKEIEATIPGTVVISKDLPALKVDETSEVFILSGDTDLKKLQGKKMTITGKVQRQNNKPWSIAVEHVKTIKKLNNLK